jgi:hypothetical protein
MRNFIEAALSGNSLQAKELLQDRIKELVFEKAQALRQIVMAEMFDDTEDEFEIIEEEVLDEAGNVMKSGRTKVIRVRIRNGKVQRRKRLSAVQGYTIRGGKMVRMSPQERRHRKMAARRAKFKRRAKLRQSLRKRKMSLRRRHAMGL